jgi:hypothetical protein
VARVIVHPDTPTFDLPSTHFARDRVFGSS